MQNELGVLEFIHALVETLDKFFENVCELDIMFNIEKAHFILGLFHAHAHAHSLTRVKLQTHDIPAHRLACGWCCIKAWVDDARSRSHPLFARTAEEMVMNGCIVETNKTNILKPVVLLEKVAAASK